MFGPGGQPGQVPDTYGEGDVSRYDVRLSQHVWNPGDCTHNMFQPPNEG